MFENSRAYADRLHGLVNPLQDLLDTAYTRLNAIRSTLPKPGGEDYQPALVSNFKGFVLEEATGSIGGFVVYQDGNSIILEDEDTGLKTSLRRPLQNRSVHYTVVPQAETMPSELALFDRPQPEELLAMRQPRPTDTSAVVWDWPRKRGELSPWGLQFVLAAAGSTVDSMNFDLRLDFPKEVRPTDEMSGFVPDESPLVFLDDQDTGAEVEG